MKILEKMLADPEVFEPRNMPVSMRAVKYAGEQRALSIANRICAHSPHTSGMFERWFNMQSAWLDDDFRAWKKACASYLLGVGVDAKTVKGQKIDIMTGIMYLAPHTESGFNMCSHASPDCAKFCLRTSGRLRFDGAQIARILKTWGFRFHTEFFIRWLEEEIRRVTRKALGAGMKPYIRLNGLSDYPWHMKYPGLFTDNPAVQFYDYTKVPRTIVGFLDGLLPDNYHMTFSRSELNDDTCQTLLSKGVNVAVVFNEALPKTWKGFKVVNGDASDARPDDTKRKRKRGLVIGLTAKGALKRAETEFKVSGIPLA